MQGMTHHLPAQFCNVWCSTCPRAPPSQGLHMRREMGYMRRSVLERCSRVFAPLLCEGYRGPPAGAGLPPGPDATAGLAEGFLIACISPGATADPSPPSPCAASAASSLSTRKSTAAPASSKAAGGGTSASGGAGAGAPTAAAGRPAATSGRPPAGAGLPPATGGLAAAGRGAGFFLRAMPSSSSSSPPSAAATKVPAAAPRPRF